MGKWIVAMAVAFTVLCASAWAGEVSVKALPPSVVVAAPESGDGKVDPATTEITIKFSKEMSTSGFSLAQINAETFPKITAQPKFKDDRRTCVVGVKLESKKAYAIWINSDKFKNFKDADGNPAVPYLLVFETK